MPTTPPASPWTARLVILALLAIIVGVPLLYRPQVKPPSEPSLVIMSPHNEQIRFEYDTAFNRWRREQGLEPVYFDWRSPGGTSDQRRQILSEFTSKAQRGEEDQGIGYDLFFGGGSFDHEQLARGVTVTRNDRTVTIPVTVAPNLPEGLLETAFPEPTLAGERLYHPDKRWIGVVLASFGIVYNRDALALLDLPEPQVWRDLAHPNYFGWVALADPGHSGSIAATYDTILRRMGWEAGWATLRRASANARYFTASAGRVPVDVSAGEAAAGMCIDFYGRYQAGAIGGDRVGYVDPPFMTAISPDPISLLRGAPHREIAEQFIAWILSPEGQDLWQLKIDQPGGPAVGRGPERYELRRVPIRHDLYERDPMPAWADDVNPFAIAKPLPPEMPSYFGLVAPVAHAMAIAVHDDLKAAWKAIQSHPDHPQRAEMLRLFDAMPPELCIRWPDDDLRENWQQYLETPDHPRRQEIATALRGFAREVGERWQDADQRGADRLAWTQFFMGNYRRIVELAEQ